MKTINIITSIKRDFNIFLRRHEVGIPTEDASSNPNIDILIAGRFVRDRQYLKQRVDIRPSNCTDVQIVYIRYNKFYLYKRDCVSILERGQNNSLQGATILYRTSENHRNQNNSSMNPSTNYHTFFCTNIF